MKDVFVVAAVRTPVGSFLGGLMPITATQLGAKAIQGALLKAGINASEIQEVFMGNVCSAGLGQAPARQAALLAGLSNTTPCTTVNKVCASGAKAIMFGAQSIMLGLNDVVIAGGMESMSNVPHYVLNYRSGFKYGNTTLIDGLAHDGLTDPYNGFKAMGAFGDATAKKYGFTREDQDQFAIDSYQKATESTKNGFFKKEIVAVNVPQRKGDAVLIEDDEQYKMVNYGKIPELKPAFNQDGTVTAANSSPLNDGAAALILVSEEKLKSLGLTPIARIMGFADAAHEPEWFTTAPVLAAPIALKRAGLTKNDIDIFEVNEAFANVPMYFTKEMDVDPKKVNPYGGAVALGHPIGCSGARIMTTLINGLQTQNKKYGLIAICNGGGGASSIVIEKV
jgi:acetyl-CoA C-acetyltransferase